MRAPVTALWNPLSCFPQAVLSQPLTWPGYHLSPEELELIWWPALAPGPSDGLAEPSLGLTATWTLLPSPFVWSQICTVVQEGTLLPPPPRPHSPSLYFLSSLFPLIKSLHLFLGELTQLTSSPVTLVVNGHPLGWSPVMTPQPCFTQTPCSRQALCLSSPSRLHLRVRNTRDSIMEDTR